MADKRKIIMDVDTGSDDAVALILAMTDPFYDLLGITSVNGNLEVKLTTENSLRIVEFMGKQDTVKVYKGADLPICSTLLPTTPQSLAPIPRREGSSIPEGLHHAAHIPTPSYTIREEEESAVEWLVETLLAADDGEITLVPVGPLTNIALAMRADPRILPKIREIVIMGGTAYRAGSKSMTAEFNIWIDPEALGIVLQSGCRITMVSLDATFAAYITTADAERIRSIGTKEADMVANLILKYGTNAMLAEEKEKHIPIHDALALYTVQCPEVLDAIETNVHCDISGGFAYGQTIVDRRDKRNNEDNCRFALGADREMFVGWIIRTLEDARDRGEHQLIR